MTPARTEASRLVAEVTKCRNRIAYVTAEDAERLLGDYYGLMTQSAIRRWGPIAGTHYPWNVIDFLAEKLEKTRTTKSNQEE